VRWVREPRPRRAGHRPGDGRATRRRQWGCQHTERRWHLVASRRSPRAAFWPPPELCPFRRSLFTSMTVAPTSTSIRCPSPTCASSSAISPGSS